MLQMGLHHANSASYNLDMMAAYGCKWDAIVDKMADVFMKDEEGNVKEITSDKIGSTTSQLCLVGNGNSCDYGPHNDIVQDQWAVWQQMPRTPNAPNTAPHCKEAHVMGANRI